VIPDGGTRQAEGLDSQGKRQAFCGSGKKAGLSVKEIALEYALIGLLLLGQSEARFLV